MNPAETTVAITFAAMSAGLTAYVAAVSHRAWSATRWRELRWFSFVAVTATAFLILRIPVLTSSSLALIRTVRSVQVAFAMVHVICWRRYSDSYLGRQPHALDRWLERLLLASAAVSLWPGLIYGPAQRRQPHSWLPLSHPDPALTPFGNLLISICILAAFFFLVQSLRGWFHRPPHAGLHVLVLVLVIVVAANDVLSANGLLATPAILDLGLTAAVVTVGYSVTARFAQDTRALSELRLHLETVVAERTADLARAQEALLRSEKLASVGQLAGGVAHEVNNPAAVVSANLRYLTAALEKDELPPDALECLRESRESMDRITAIVRQLVDASRSTARARAPAGPVPVAPAVHESLRLARTRCPERVELVAEVPAELSALAQRDILVQVLTSVVLNGAQAIPEHRRGRVAVRAAGAAGRVQITVEDDGIGMEPDVLRRVFEPFFSTRPVGKGIGLGLAVSRGLAMSLGGDLRLESSPGRGTRAILDLPAAAPPDGARTLTPAP